MRRRFDWGIFWIVIACDLTFGVFLALFLSAVK